jgi:hypothetical protein
MTSVPGIGEETIAPDEADVTTRFVTFLKEASRKRNPGGRPIQRFNQARATACVDAEFTVLDGLPAEHRVGLFAAPRTYQAWIRFANASTQSDKERDTRGMAIKVQGVAGENLTHGATAQDFILNSHPVMMVPGTREFLELLEANEAGGFRRVMYFLSHPKAARIAFASRANPTCHLDIPYWSTTPYRLGAANAVKYVAVPGSTVRSPRPGTLTDTYLRDALQSRLAQQDATFDFMIQLQKDPRRMPIEDASVEWTPEDSPYLRVARIRIPTQRPADEARSTRCEQVAFNPWNCLAEHRPLGSMNRARREIYPAMAAFRSASAAPVG